MMGLLRAEDTGVFCEFPSLADPVVYRSPNDLPMRRNQPLPSLLAGFGSAQLDLVAIPTFDKLLKIELDRTRPSFDDLVGDEIGHKRCHFSEFLALLRNPKVCPDDNTGGPTVAHMGVAILG